MGERRNIYELQELTRISCVCPCGTEIIFDVSKNAMFRDCSSCGAALYPLPEILRAYQEILRKATDAKLRVRLSSPPLGEKE